MSVETLEGGDRGCGELLMVLAARARALAPGSTLRLLSTDPAGSVELPAWCHLAGHTFLGQGHDADGRTFYDVRLHAAPGTPQRPLPSRPSPEPPRAPPSRGPHP